MKWIGKKFAHVYRNLKLQKKLTITHLIIATIPMIVLGVFFYTRLYDMIVADTIRTEQAATTQTIPLIDEAISDVLKLHSDIVSQEFYRQTFSPTRTDDLLTLASSDSASDFNTMIQNSIDETWITDIKMYLDIPRSDALFTDDSLNSTILPINNAWGTYWHGIFNGNASLSSLFCPSFYLGSYELKHNGTMAYITKSTMMYEGERTAYYLAIYLSQDYLDELLRDNLTSNSNIAYMINDRDSIVAASNMALSGTYHFSYQEVQEYFMSSNNFILKNVMGEEVYAGFHSVKNTEWYMVVAMPSQPMINKSIGIMTIFALVYILCILIAFLIATLLSHSTTNRLSIVINQMAKSRIGPPIALPETDAMDEIGDLISTYNYMTRVINQLIDEQAKAAEDLRIAEFNSLQSQINPHFLYNTMDMINWLSQQGRSQEVTSAIQKLSRFYKLTLSRKKSISSIADEIEHVSIYVQLQNMRFHNTIEFLVDIPDNLLECSIPKLTFQPVIENCILHGILEKESKQGTIVLTGWVENETVVILISDNGIGISEERLESILEGKENHSGKGNNIAVNNTHRRLQLIYGPEYGLTYASTYGHGTDVEIRIPARLLDDYESVEDDTSDSQVEDLSEHPFANALELLSHPEINIYQIASSCGYDDPQQFFTEFKDYFGYTPEEYRRQML